MKPEVVQKILGVPTYPMVAIDKSRRDEMLRILMDAAAAYVGIALPDLPARQLLRFTDQATEDAIAEVEARAARLEEDEEDYETVEVVEEIFVDEDGHVIEDVDEYEIIEEVVEEIETPSQDDEPVEADLIEETPVELPDEDEPAAEEPIEEEVKEEKPIVVEQIAMESIEAPVEEEEPSEEVIEPSVEEIELVEIETAGTEEEPVEIEFVAEEPPIQVEATNEDNGRQMAIDLIHEALEADEIISAEIEKVSKEDLDTALEAFSHDEVLPEGEEEEFDKDLDEELKRELDLIFDAYEPSRLEDEEIPSVDMDAILEIDASLGGSSEDEPKKESDE
jgi:hypothetical protein